MLEWRVTCVQVEVLPVSAYRLAAAMEHEEVAFLPGASPGAASRKTVQKLHKLVEQIDASPRVSA